MRWLAAGALAGSLVAAPRLGGRAQACGASPPAPYTLTEFLPTTAVVPRDGAVLVTGRGWSEYYPNDLGSSSGLQIRVLVTVNDAGGLHIPGRIEPWSAGVPAVLWRPEVPLPADTAFVLTAILPAPNSPPPEATGARSLQVGFRSNDQMTPPLQLADGLHVSLETYDQPRWKDCSGCGWPCVPDGNVRALRARVILPAVQGGYTPETYLAALRMSPDHPGEWSADPSQYGGATMVAGQPREVVHPLYEKDAPYAPCFSLRVFDPAGHHVDAQPVCLPTVDVPDTIRRLDEAAGIVRSAVPATTAPAEPTPVTGCSFAPAPTPAEPLPLSAVAAAWAAAAWRWRRLRARRGAGSGG